MLAPNRILVPLDFSGASDAAFRRATDLAARTGAELHVLHVVVGFEPTDAEVPEADRAFYQRIWNRAEARLGRYLQRGSTAGSAPRQALTYGPPSRAILDHAESEDIGLIVMGTHGRTGLQRFFLGSVAHEVLRRAEVPVMVVPMEARPRPLRSVLAPTDFSAASRMVLPVAADLAALYSADLDLFHAVEPARFLGAVVGAAAASDLAPSLRAGAEDKLRELAQDPDFARTLTGRDGAGDPTPVEAGGPGLARIRWGLAEGRAAETIAEAAKARNADAIVMAKRGLHGVGRFLLGSVTSRVCHLAPCAVVVIPFGPDEHPSS